MGLRAESLSSKGLGNGLNPARIPGCRICDFALLLD